MEIPAAIPESFPADWCLAVAGSRTTAREFTRADGKRTKGIAMPVRVPYVRTAWERVSP